MAEPNYSAVVPDRIRVACVQMTSHTDKAANLEAAERLVGQAASTGADIVVLPEKWNAIGDASFYHEAAEPLEGGE
jgi:nitrilase